MEYNKLPSSQELMELPVEKLTDYLSSICMIGIPVKVETVEEMKEASQLLSRAGSLYSFMTNAALIANVQKRQLKKDKEKKEEFDDALVRETIFNSYAEQLKICYNTISRMITIKQQINQELRMLGDAV